MFGMEADELTDYLSALDRGERYRVEATLKKSSHEETQVVHLVAEEGGERGPFIRKLISLDACMGQAYETIFQAQKRGYRFTHLPRIFECYRAETHLVVVMEYVRGETLQDVVYRSDPSPALALDVFPRLCEAVSELHEKFDAPLIHRDLKPTNIVLSWNNLMLVDFGISRLYRTDANEDTTHFGTRAYAPPEQFGYGQTDVRSDVYSLGMVLYYCLAEKTPDTRLRESGFDDPRVPVPLRRVLVKATELDPRSRYQSVRELLADFQKVAGKLGGAVRRGTPAATVGMARRGAPAATDGAIGSVAGAGDGARRSTAASASVWLGRAWNCCLALVFALFVVAASIATFFPNENDTAYPLWFRALEYYGFFAVGSAALFYLLLDKRRLRGRIPRIAHLTWRQELPACLGFVGCLFLVIVVVAQFVV